MLKPLTLSLGLAVALGASSVSFAGHHGTSECATCGIASPQGTVVSPQSVIASPQSCEAAPTCDTCAPKKKCFSGFKMPKLNLHMPKHTYTYEWVLKKKKVWGHHNACGDSGCSECAAAPAVYPTSQAVPSSQAPYAAPQYAAPQAAGQSVSYAAPGEMKPALAADEVPPAPTVAASSRLLQLTPSSN